MADTKSKIEGKVIEVVGPVVDIEFKKGELPEIYNAIEIVSDGFDVKRNYFCIGAKRQILYAIYQIDIGFIADTDAG